jgi:S1-C subfamily serine protease
VVRVSWPQTVTQAVVRGLRRENNAELIELDVPAHAGDNGAPILDRTGRVLGVVTTAHAGNPSSGFAIGLDSARPYFH